MAFAATIGMLSKKTGKDKIKLQDVFNPSEALKNIEVKNV
jgi:hypothetical protein